MDQQSSFYKFISDIKKMNNIKNSGADQYMYETLTWSRALEFYKLENAFLRTRLSQVLDSNSDKVFLAAAEHYNNRFVFMDEYIKELKQDIRLQVQMIKQHLADNHLQDKVMIALQRKLRGEMEKFEKDINGLKYDFNKKLVNYFEIN